jgi:ABC-type branched-subunit amino acid transport system ATPase component
LRRVAARRGLASTALAPAASSVPPAPRVALETSADTRTAALRVRGLDVEYDGVQVLFGVDVDVIEGETVAVLGTNGSGKSTLLRTVSGLVRARHGAITFFGNDTTRLAPERIAALGLGNAPGGAGVFPSLTVDEHLRLARWLRRDANTRPDDALARFPQLAARRRERAGNLSGGEQQLLTLTMTLLMQPRMLLVDELTLGLAPAVADQVVHLLRELRAAGTTIVVVEQSLDIALQVADRAYFLEHGEVRFEGSPQALRDRPDLVRAVFLGRAAEAPPAAPSHARAEEPRLVVDAVTKHYGGVVALDDVSFTVGAGEIVGFVGANGAGKTTLFDVISGFVESDGGAITMFTSGGDAIDLTHRPPHMRAQRGLGRSFQDGRLFPALTVRETIAVALEHAVRVRDPVSAALHLPAVARSEAAIAKRVDELVGLLGLDDYADRFVHELSTGTRRLVDLACVLGHEPSVLLLDEPSSGLAQREAEALAPLLLRVRDELGASVLVIEHDVPLLRAVAGRLVGLDLGRVVATGDPSAVLHDPAVSRAFLGTT